MSRIAAGLALVFALTSAALPAAADMLIQIPTADRVTRPSTEFLFRPERELRTISTLLVPVGVSHELMFRHWGGFGTGSLEGGGQLTVLPDGVLTPAVAIGLWDITNSSPYGRRGFLALTKALRPGILGTRPLKRLHVTLGTGTGRFSGFLGGIRFDFNSRVSVLAEYDSRRFNFGLWVSPVKSVVLKGQLINGEPFVGGEIRAGF